MVWKASLWDEKKSWTPRRAVSIAGLARIEGKNAKDSDKTQGKGGYIKMANHYSPEGAGAVATDGPELPCGPLTWRTSKVLNLSSTRALTRLIPSTARVTSG